LENQDDDGKVTSETEQAMTAYLEVDAELLLLLLLLLLMLLRGAIFIIGTSNGIKNFKTSHT
jgi:hypothetical protein